MLGESQVLVWKGGPDSRHWPFGEYREGMGVVRVGERLAAEREERESAIDMERRSGRDQGPTADCAEWIKSPWPGLSLSLLPAQRERERGRFHPSNGGTPLLLHFSQHTSPPPLLSPLASSLNGTLRAQATPTPGAVFSPLPPLLPPRPCPRGGRGGGALKL